MIDLSKMPKWATLSGAIVLFGILAFGMYYVAFGKDAKKKEPAVKSVTLTVPDAEGNETGGGSQLESMSRGKTSRRSVSDYWDSLGEEDGDLDVGLSKTSVQENKEEYLDPAEYSEYEIYQIRNGLKSKADIDAAHAAARERQRLEEAERRRKASQTKSLTPEQEDSAYFARLEKAYQIAAKYNTQPVSEAAPEQAPSEEPDRKIELPSQNQTMPVDGFSGDGIITSLDDEGVTAGGGVGGRPAKATFLKTEKLSDGQRVIIRLMQDMALNDGTVIPANTHITGVCSVGKRLKISVTMLHYNGKMFPVDISVYDNDGTEGIYCPLATQPGKKGRKAKQVAGEVVQGAGTVAGTLLTGDPFLGRAASSGVTAASSSIQADGTVEVRIASGYEFYVFENIKEE